MQKSLFSALGLVLICFLGFSISAHAANSCSATAGDKGPFAGQSCTASCDLFSTAHCQAGGLLSAPKCECITGSGTDHRSPSTVSAGLLSDAIDFADYVDNYGSSNMSILATKSSAVIAIVQNNGLDVDFQDAEDEWLVAWNDLTSTERADCESWASARGY